MATGPKAKVVETKDIPLDQLEVGVSQARTRDVTKNLDLLVSSIAEIGLLQPIVVCPKEGTDLYEICAGQRRFLAHKELELETIAAVVLDRSVSEIEAKIISFTENIVRQGMVRADCIDVCRHFYDTYGTIAEVSRQTGLKEYLVRKYLKIQSLHPDVQDAYTAGLITMEAALRASKACDPEGLGDVEPQVIIDWAKTMSNLSGVEIDAVVGEIKNPNDDHEEVLERARSKRQHSVVAQLSTKAYEAFVSYKDDEEMTQADAAAGLILEGLEDAGYSIS